METAERPSLGSLPAVRRLFERALEALMQAIPATRGVVLFGDDELHELRPRVARGLDMDNFWLSGPVSTGLLREVRADGRPRLVQNAVGGDTSLSLALSGAHSLICVPFWGPSGSIDGLLYADTRRPNMPLTKEHLDEGLRLANKLTADLEQVVKPGGTPPRPDSGSRRRRPSLRSKRTGSDSPKLPVVPRRAAAPAARPLPSGRVIPTRRSAPEAVAPLRPARSSLSQPSLQHALMVFYRGVATMIGAGVPLVRAIQLLAFQGEHHRLRQALAACLRELDGGQRLSRAMRSHPEIFSPVHVALVQVGEETGSLHRVFDRLARYQEKSSALRAKVVSALAYPAMVTVACLLMLILIPALTFQGLFEVMEGLKVPLPLATRLLMVGLRIIGSPFGLLLGVAVIASLLAFRHWLRSSVGARRLFQRALERIPGVGTALRTAAMASLARTLATLYSAGAPVVKALELTAEGAANPLLRDALVTAKAEVLEGQPLHRALESSGYFPPLFVHVVAAGESVGRVAEMLEKAADLAEESVEEALMKAVATLQPILLAGVGFLTGFMVLAMMTPLIRMTQML